jgi:hypothetical protein
MDQGEPSRPEAPPIPAEPDALRQDIELTRQELAETIDALAWKADVSNRAKDKARELRTRAQRKADQNQVTAAAMRQPWIAAATVGGVLLALVGLGYLSRRRRSSS